MMSERKVNHRHKENRENWPLPQIDPARCTGCGRCVKACPNHVIELAGGLAVLAFPERCDYSGLCKQVCLDRAIELYYEIIWQGEVKGG